MQKRKCIQNRFAVNIDVFRKKAGQLHRTDSCLSMCVDYLKILEGYAMMMAGIFC